MSHHPFEILEPSRRGLRHRDVALLHAIDQPAAVLPHIDGRERGRRRSATYSPAGDFGHCSCGIPEISYVSGWSGAGHSRDSEFQGLLWDHFRDPCHQTNNAANHARPPALIAPVFPRQGDPPCFPLVPAACWTAALPHLAPTASFAFPKTRAFRDASDNRYRCSPRLVLLVPR
jgi:hypothetical protein